MLSAKFREASSFSKITMHNQISFIFLRQRKEREGRQTQVQKLSKNDADTNRDLQPRPISHATQWHNDPLMNQMPPDGISDEVIWCNKIWKNFSLSQQPCPARQEWKRIWPKILTTKAMHRTIHSTGTSHVLQVPRGKSRSEMFTKTIWVASKDIPILYSHF